MRVFIDTEFTDFIDMQLLSIGLVSEAGKCLYLESCDPQRIESASDFCKVAVLTQFGEIEGSVVESDAQAGREVLLWLRGLGERIEVMADYPGDHMLLNRILMKSGMWNGSGPDIVFTNIGDVYDNPLCEMAAQSFIDSIDRPHPHLTRHHALIDALALRQAWMVMARKGG